MNNYISSKQKIINYLIFSIFEKKLLLHLAKFGHQTQSFRANITLRNHFDKQTTSKGYLQTEDS
jgi:hypothetical protein